MNNKAIIIAGVLAGVLLILVLPRFFGDDEDVVEVVTEQVERPAPQPAPVRTAPEPPPMPAAIAEPVAVVDTAPEVMEPEPEPVILPELNNSDPFVIEQIAELDEGTAIIQQLTSGQSVRKFVVMIDNMSRGDIPVRDLPVLGPRRELTAVEQGENLYVMEPASYERFDEAVNTFTEIRTEDAVAMLTLFGPLFEKAYAELGYRDSQFSTVLEQTISNVLNAPRVIDDEIMLTRPSVFYKFANPELENLSSVEKLLIRMGPENAEKVQDKVQAIHDAMASSAEQ